MPKIIRRDYGRNVMNTNVSAPWKLDIVLLYLFGADSDGIHINEIGIIEVRASRRMVKSSREEDRETRSTFCHCPGHTIHSKGLNLVFCQVEDLGLPCGVPSQPGPRTRASIDSHRREPPEASGGSNNDSDAILRQHILRLVQSTKSRNHPPAATTTGDVCYSEDMDP